MDKTRGKRLEINSIIEFDKFTNLSGLVSVITPLTG